MAEQNDVVQESGVATMSVEERPAAPGSEAMRRDIETTRAAIGVKLGALQDNVRAVQSQAKHLIDLRYQIERHPLPAVGIAVALGFVAGSLGSAEAGAQTPADSAMPGEAAAAHPPRRRLQTARGELFGTLKLALGAALMELARQAIHTHMPTIGGQLDKVWEGRGLTSVSAASALFGKDRSTPQ